MGLFKRADSKVWWMSYSVGTRRIKESTRTHDLRHTAATRYRRAGVDLLTLQKIGGWKTLEMLKRYNTIDDEDLREAVRKITK